MAPLEPMLVPQQTMRGVEDIERGISGFVKYWEDLCNVDVTREYRRGYEHLVQYWSGMKEALYEPTNPCNVLREGFWPTTRVEANVGDPIAEDGEDRERFVRTIILYVKKKYMYKVWWKYLIE